MRPFEAQWRRVDVPGRILARRVEDEMKFSTVFLGRTNVLLALAAMLAITFVFARMGQAEPPPTWLNYQGRLSAASGEAVADGQYSVVFRLFAAPTGGTSLWSETRTVTAKGGVFATTLGQATPFPEGLFTQRLWLEIEVQGRTLTPRQELGAVAFSHVALRMPGGAVTTVMIADLAITTEKLADGAVTSAKLAADSTSLSKMTSGLLSASGRLVDVDGELSADNLPLIPRSRMGRGADSWSFFLTHNMANSYELTEGGVVSRDADSVSLQSHSGKASIYSGSWAPITTDAQGTPARFLVRWRTNTISPGYRALLRIGIDLATSEDMSGGASLRGCGFKQVGPVLNAYWDLGDGQQRLHPIRTIPAPYHRYLGEVCLTSRTLSFYINGGLVHTVELPEAVAADFPFGRISLVSQNRGGGGVLEVGFLARIGWGG